MKSSNHISPGKRVEFALQKKFIDKVPFAVYGTFWGSPGIENPVFPFEKYFPQATIERNLRNNGTCIVDSTYWGFQIKRPNTTIVSTVFDEDGRFMVRTDYKTPLGDLYTIKEVTDYTIWIHKKMFSTPEDFKKILFIINDSAVLPDYEKGVKLIDMLGEDIILRGDIGLEPLQELITGDYFTTDDFCLQWMDNRDEMIDLYNALVEIKRKIYKVVSKSPLYFICYGGNVTPYIISPENFEKYYFPNYEEAAEVLHKNGKILGCHFDADLKNFKDIIAKSSLDVIEAFTPYPDTQMTVKEAREVWKEKVLWVNFPSSLHLSTQEKIAETTIKIINEGGPEGLVIGITEDVPELRRWENFSTIINTIDKYFK